MIGDVTIFNEFDQKIFYATGKSMMLTIMEYDDNLYFYDSIFAWTSIWAL
jgi:hypothetical protein